MSEYIKNPHTHSCMDFSHFFNEDQVTGDQTFYIEKSNFRKIQCKEVKTVELITLMPDNRLFFIEAKTTAPNANNSANKERMDEYYNDLVEKIQQSVDMVVSHIIGVKRDQDNEFPAAFFETEFSQYKLKYLLIIRNSNKDWCFDVKDRLERR